MVDVCDVPVISSVCDVAGDAAGALVSAPFDWLAQGMGHAAGWMFEAVWKVFDSTTMVDVTDIKGIKPGDEVVLFGRQGDAEVKQSDLEEYNGALLADMYTVWGYTNPKKIKR